ncbi:hypothetical protein [Asticcacaulis sp. 201]|uniref:hypothetical protein n=1 Tax=Asticcacaulis sp. 201 TaxID=3028787 RepID=UPI0029169F26|nr:hypothetical protein [Asticcacaulis sp. 201]MDV6333166.1 hypothetical protein [Asticcacaulis sp. 201]
MKFQIRDETDKALVISLQHEFMRCDDAFNELVHWTTKFFPDTNPRRASYRAYNSYARFVHHLYEFMMGAINRDRRDTTSIRADEADRLLTREFQKIITRRRAAILEGRAPAWENDISAYPEDVSPSVATEFRRLRNTIIGHAKHERASLSLSDFFQRNHMYLYLLYEDTKWLWLPKKGEFPDLGEITAFSLAVQHSPSIQTSTHSQ